MINTIEKKQEKPRMYPDGYNTLRKRKLLKALETEPTLRQAGIKAGYSCISQNIYKKSIKRYMAKNIHSNPEGIKERFEDIANRSVLEKDATNELRAIESLARINAMFIERTREEGKPQAIIINYGNTKTFPPPLISPEDKPSDVKPI